jgi:DNA-binding HxlR family transcriptional regulator
MQQAGIDEPPQVTAADEKTAQPRSHRAWTPLARALTATGDRWTLMIVLALASGRMRLTGLYRRLPGVSTGVLERHVQQMVALGLVSRTRFKEMPPRVELELTDAGRELLPVAGALARWGMRNRWSPPAERERVDVDVLLRILPALLDGQTRLPCGLVEVVLAGADPPVSHVYRVRRGRLSFDECAQDTQDGRRGSKSSRGRRREQASVLVEGDEQAWIAALGPAGDCSRLRLTGDTQLAKSLFDALPR